MSMADVVARKRGKGGREREGGRRCVWCYLGVLDDEKHERIDVPAFNLQFVGYTMMEVKCAEWYHGVGSLPCRAVWK